MLGARLLAVAMLCTVLGGCGEGTVVPVCTDDDGDGFGEGCTAGLDCDDSDADVRPGATETCDGTDEDCDGAIDTGCACEDGASRACGSDIGVCQAGNQSCEDGAWAACVGASAPSEERCDGAQDEDCDGMVDEDCACTEGATRPCGTDVGECEVGVETCTDGAWSTCGGAVEPAAEVCEGTLDESCDGTVDEGCACTTGAERACGTDVGACELGSQTCAAGAWGACNAVEPIPEVCGNADDDDCDGETNEGCGPCPILTVSCAAGCCAIPEAQIVADGHWPSIAIDSAGRIFVSYTLATSASRTARIAIYDPATATWADRLLGQGGDRSAVRIGVGDSVHVLHGTDPAWAMSGPNMRYQRSDDHGATFTPIGGSPGVLEIGGTLDLAIDAANHPHVTFDGSMSGSSALFYAHHDGASWSTTRLDPTSGFVDHPRIALGFADRPSIVYEARVLGAPPSGSAVRQVFFDGSGWVARDVDTGAYYSETDTRFTAYDHEVDADDSARVLYTRRVSTVTELVLARRTAGPTGTWTAAALMGASNLGNARLGRTATGAPFAISNGLAVHREAAGGTWTTTTTGPTGTEPAIARVGNSVYVVFTGTRPGATHPLLLTRIDL